MVLRRNENGSITLSQSNKILKLCKRFKPAKQWRTPTGEDFLQPSPEDDDDVSPTEYLSLVQSLMQLAQKTRPDILTAVSYLSNKCKSPKHTDFRKALRVLGYLEGTIALVILIDTKTMQAYVYIDASFGATVHGDGKGHSGIYFTLGTFGVPLYWRSIKQKVVARSSTEAELIALFDGMDLLLWARAVLDWIGYPQLPTILYQDNTSTITIAYMGHGAATSHTRYLDMKYFWIKQYLDSGVVVLQYMETERMPADFFATPRLGNRFSLMVEKIMG